MNRANDRRVSSLSVHQMRDWTSGKLNCGKTEDHEADDGVVQVILDGESQIRSGRRKRSAHPLDLYAQPNT